MSTHFNDFAYFIINVCYIYIKMITSSSTLISLCYRLDFFYLLMVEEYFLRIVLCIFSYDETLFFFNMIFWYIYALYYKQKMVLKTDIFFKHLQVTSYSLQTSKILKWSISVLNYTYFYSISMNWSEFYPI